MELNQFILDNRLNLPILHNESEYSELDNFAGWLLLHEGKYYLLEEFTPALPCAQCTLLHVCRDFFLFNSDFSQGLLISCNCIYLTLVKHKQLILETVLRNQILKLYRRS